MYASSPSNEITEYVLAVRSRAPHLPTVMTPDHEERIIATLRPYWERIKENRARFERGELKAVGAEQARGTAYRHTALTEEEEAALFDAYCMLLQQVGLIAGRLYRKVDEYTRLTLEDFMQHTWEAFCRTVSAYDPDNCTKLTTWIGIDFRMELFNRVKSAQASEPPLDTSFLDDIINEAGPEALHIAEGPLTDTTMPDWLDYVDLDAWATDFTAGNDTLRIVYQTLSTGDSTKYR